MDERAAVGAGLDFVFCYVSEGDARDFLVAVRKNVQVAIDEELKGLDERISLSGAGAGFDAPSLPT